MPNPGWQPPEQLSADERRFVLLFAGAWLIFLAWPISVAHANPAVGPVARGAAIAAIVVFAFLYLAFFVRPRLVGSLPLAANTFLQSLVLILLMAAAMPAAGEAVSGMVPYLMALWLFNHRLIPGMAAAFAVAVAGSLAVTAIGGGVNFAVLSPILLSAGIIGMFRLAFEHAEMERAYSERVALAEQREELARTVHDALGQSLTSITLQAQLARRHVPSDPDGAREQLDGILATARDSLRDVRSVVEFLDAPGLDEQLERARTTLAAAGIEATVPHPGELPHLDPAQRRLFSWCLREAITNVVRHSGATRCTVAVIGGVGGAGARDDAVLRVSDDGTGIAGGMGGSAVAKGTGLRGLARRAEKAGAALSLSDAATGDVARPGTTLEVRA